MAAVTLLNSTADTTVSPNVSGAFSPTSSDLLVVFVSTFDAVGSHTLSSSIGGFTFTVVSTVALWSSSGNTIYCYVADSLVSDTSSQTVTLTHGGDSWTGTVLGVFGVSGITRIGLNAVRQVANDENRTSGATPATVFGSAVLTGNPTLAMLANGVNPATVTAPTNWTESADIGHATPDHGGEFIFRNSGFTGTTITWGSTYGANGGALAIELDTTTAGTTISPNAAGMSV